MLPATVTDCPGESLTSFSDAYELEPAMPIASSTIDAWTT